MFKGRILCVGRKEVKICSRRTAISNGSPFNTEHDECLYRLRVVTIHYTVTSMRCSCEKARAGAGNKIEVR